MMNSGRKSRKAELERNLTSVTEKIFQAASASGRRASEITLIVVTKNFPLSDVEALYELGVRDFGENRDEEGSVKEPALPSDVRWHFQGQIQSRKIASILKWSDLVHSLDSLSHAKKIEAHLGEAKDFFLQVNLEEDRPDRGGVAQNEVKLFLNSAQKFSKIRISGLMTVAPLGAPADAAFADLSVLHHKLLPDFPDLNSLSMGMSQDFPEAIRCGATHIRVGSSILGERSALT